VMAVIGQKYRLKLPADLHPRVVGMPGLGFREPVVMQLLAR